MFSSQNPEVSNKSAVELSQLRLRNPALAMLFDCIRRLSEEGPKAESRKALIKLQSAKPLAEAESLIGPLLLERLTDRGHGSSNKKFSNAQLAAMAMGIHVPHALELYGESLMKSAAKVVGPRSLVAPHVREVAEAAIWVMRCCVEDLPEGSAHRDKSLMQYTRSCKGKKLSIESCQRALLDLCRSSPRCAALFAAEAFDKDAELQQSRTALACLRPSIVVLSPEQVAKVMQTVFVVALPVDKSPDLELLIEFADQYPEAFASEGLRRAGKFDLGWAIDNTRRLSSPEYKGEILGEFAALTQDVSVCRQLAAVAMLGQVALDTRPLSTRILAMIVLGDRSGASIEASPEAALAEHVINRIGKEDSADLGREAAF